LAANAKDSDRARCDSKNGIVAAESTLAAKAGVRILRERRNRGMRDAPSDDGSVEPMMNGIRRRFIRDCVRR